MYTTFTQHFETLSMTDLSGLVLSKPRRLLWVSSTETVAFFASVWYSGFVLALFTYPLLTVNRRMSYRSSILTNLTTRTSCVVKSFGIVSATRRICLCPCLCFRTRWGIGRVFYTSLVRLLFLFGFEPCCSVGINGLLCEVVGTSSSNAEDTPTVPSMVTD